MSRAYRPKSQDLTHLSQTAKQGLANLALEGIVPSDASLTDLQLLDSGQISVEEYLKRAVKRAKAA